MKVKACMPVRHCVNLVVPLPHEGTAKRAPDTAAPAQARPGAVGALIGPVGLRHADVNGTNDRSTPPATPGTRTSTTATRTTTTRATKAAPAPSADPPGPTPAPFTFQQLVLAYLACRRSKRNSASALAFEARLEHHLCALHDELASGAWRPARSICFVVTHPKPREVWAATFRDRVVHHLLYAHIAPRFEAAFSADSCACIPGRGTLYAARRLEHQVRGATANWARPAHYLQCDLANFFVAIDKAVLREQLHLRVHEPWWRWLTDTVLMHDPRTDYELRGNSRLLQRVPPHKSLFNAPAATGLPIGNLSSQFFANVYLDALDQHVKHRLRAPRYVRYVDDFVLVHQSAEQLRAWHDDIAAFLPERLHAHLNPRKTVLQPAARGIRFVGHIVKPWRRLTRPATVARAVHRVQHQPAADVWATGNSYLGLLRQATHSRCDRRRLAIALLERGLSMDGGWTRASKVAAR
jgi:RNA-directed DNA polymerase